LKNGVNFQVALNKNVSEKSCLYITAMKTPGMAKHTQSLVGPGSIILH